MTTVTAQAAGTTKVAVKVIGSFEATSENRHRGWTWHVGADCSKYGQQQQGRPDHWRWTAVYDGHSATVRKWIEGISGPWNQPCTRAHRRDTTCCPVQTLVYTRTASLNWILSGALSHRSWQISLLTRSHRRREHEFPYHPTQVNTPRLNPS